MYSDAWVFSILSGQLGDRDGTVFFWVDGQDGEGTSQSQIPYPVTRVL